MILFSFWGFQCGLGFDGRLLDTVDLLDLERTGRDGGSSKVSRSLKDKYHSF